MRECQVRAENERERESYKYRDSKYDRERRKEGKRRSVCMAKFHVFSPCIDCWKKKKEKKTTTPASPKREKREEEESVNKKKETRNTGAKTGRRGSR